VAYQGRSAEAIAMLTAVLDEEPDSAAGLASLSAVLILANRPSEATEVAKTAVALHPDLAITHGALAWAFFKHGNLDEALGSYERAIEIDPANPDLRAGYGATLSTIGRHREAIIAFQRSLALDRDYLDRNPELAEHYSESLNTLS
jgi:tetratricopeptide (TPR) repeat protein